MRGLHASPTTGAVRRGKSTTQKLRTAAAKNRLRSLESRKSTKRRKPDTGVGLVTTNNTSSHHEETRVTQPPGNPSFLPLINQPDPTHSALSSILRSIDYIPPHQINNVVCTFSLGQNYVNLVELSHAFDYITYNPWKFAAAVIRNKKPKTSFLIFCTGVVVCTGAKTVQESRLGAQMMCNYFLANGHPFVMSNFEVRNVVGIMWCPFRFDLDRMYSSNMVDTNVVCSYSPELFPGLVVRVTEPKSVFLVFQSGKIVCTGAKSQEKIECAFEYAYSTIFRHYVDRSAPDDLIDQYPRILGQGGPSVPGMLVPMGPQDARRSLEASLAASRIKSPLPLSSESLTNPASVLSLGWNAATRATKKHATEARNEIWKLVIANERQRELVQ